MNKVLILLFSAFALSSCEMEDEKDRPCPIVASEKIPDEVMTGFKTEYPADSVITWFNKDNNGYVALFNHNNTKKLAQFDNKGIFVKEEPEMEQDGEHHDDDDKGCDCETDKDEDDKH